MQHGEITGYHIQFIKPMYALGVQSLPEGPDWLYEIKLDGYRCLDGRDASGVSLWSRKGNALTSQFPQLPKHVTVCRPDTRRWRDRRDGRRLADKPRRYWAFARKRIRI